MHFEYFPWPVFGVQYLVVSDQITEIQRFSVFAGKSFAFRPLGFQFLKN